MINGMSCVRPGVDHVDARICKVPHAGRLHRHAGRAGESCDLTVGFRHRPAHRPPSGGDLSMDGGSGAVDGKHAAGEADEAQGSWNPASLGCAERFG